MPPITQRTVLVSVVVIALWILWGVFAVGELVPLIQKRLTMWPWLIAWILCVIPVGIIAVAVLLRERSAESVKD